MKGMNLLMVLSLAGLSGLPRRIDLIPQHDYRQLRAQKNIENSSKGINLDNRSHIYGMKRRNTVRNYHGI